MEDSASGWIQEIFRVLHFIRKVPFHEYDDFSYLYWSYPLVTAAIHLWRPKIIQNRSLHAHSSCMAYLAHWLSKTSSCSVRCVVFYKLSPSFTRATNRPGNSGGVSFCFLFFFYLFFFLILFSIRITGLFSFDVIYSHRHKTETKYKHQNNKTKYNQFCQEPKCRWKERSIKTINLN